ncbi:MAG TPA: FtsX-like permease family protein [Acidobacteriota bacterium]|nr:FtsX-like permease family protein [Acidobacteriota bacterium]
MKRDWSLAENCRALIPLLSLFPEYPNEIGLRRALGARRQDVSRQFIMEAVSSSVSGAIMGYHSQSCK